MGLFGADASTSFIDLNHYEVAQQTESKFVLQNSPTVQIGIMIQSQSQPHPKSGQYNTLSLKGAVSRNSGKLGNYKVRVK